MSERAESEALERVQIAVVQYPEAACGLEATKAE